MRPPSWSRSPSWPRPQLPSWLRHKTGRDTPARLLHNWDPYLFETPTPTELVEFSQLVETPQLCKTPPAVRHLYLIERPPHSYPQASREPWATALLICECQTFLDQSAIYEYYGQWHTGRLAFTGTLTVLSLGQVPHYTQYILVLSLYPI